MKRHDVDYPRLEAFSTQFSGKVKASLTMRDITQLVHGSPNDANLRQIFTLFDPASTGFIDFRILLTCCVCTLPLSLELKSDYLFHLFDREQIGYLSITALSHMLQGTHFSNDIQEASDKAQQLMASVSLPGNMSLKEFKACVNKYSSIVFPASTKQI
eukprot:TRINITY_DN10050_c0_g1_i2.p1 TRINITY_DN10050_c0_g1~~TRINITY_DN10050_c0_g1_i2.p1  ORF type:complete len:158 (+),score=20.80 TRINITY_DN10050_c0_g1_i2:64-537(+)